MTCIAWDGKTLAADRNTALQHDGIVKWAEHKIFRINNKLLGFSGSTLIRDKIIEWITNGLSDVNKPNINEKEEFSFLVVDVIDKKVFLYNDSLNYSSLPYDYKLAIGSLGSEAEGAMIIGATAEEAVTTALNTYKLRPEVKYYDVDVLEANIQKEEENETV